MVRGIVVTGPTASGKTRLAVHLARRFGGEIVSADSRQLYRGLDIGSGKDLAEYGEGEDRVPVHLIDIADPMEEYNLSRFLEDARTAVAEIAERGRVPIVCGGTPLYVHALVAEYELPAAEPDWELRAELEGKDLEELVAMLESERPDFASEFKDKANKRRVIRAIEAGRFAGREGEESAARPLSEVGSEGGGGAMEWFCLATAVERSELWGRIADRLDARLESGLIEEVESLLERGVTFERLRSFGLEYRFVASYLKGELSKEEMREKLFIAIRRFAKRQETWFRKMEREGVELHRLPPDDYAGAERLVADFFETA